MALPIIYSVVILPKSGGVVSRCIGSNLEQAKQRAIERRQDFPDALEIRVVSAEQGVIATF